MVKAYIVKELHKPAKPTKVFRKVFSAGKDDIWSIDLVDMTKYEAENDGYGWILTCIDLFTRYAWAIPMKTKSKKDSWKAFKEILDSGRTPTKIWSDQGTEFLNDDWSTQLKSRNITLYFTGAEKKAVMVERLNRTIKTWMWQIFTAKENHSWVGILPGLLKRYNNKVHSAINMTPDQASTHNRKATPLRDEALGKPKYELRDWVRISNYKDKFDKGYTTNWSKELFQIVRIVLNKPVMYYLRDINGDAIQGGFYENELHKTKQTVEDYIKSVTKSHNKPGQVVVERVLSWREDVKSKAKFNKFILKVELSDGSSEEVPLGNYIGIEKNGVFKATTRNPVHILSPIGDYLRSIPRLKREVYDVVLG